MREHLRSGGETTGLPVGVGFNGEAPARAVADLYAGLGAVCAFGAEATGGSGGGSEGKNSGNGNSNDELLRRAQEANDAAERRARERGKPTLPPR